MFGPKALLFGLCLTSLVSCRSRNPEEDSATAAPSASAGPKATDAQKAMAKPLPEAKVLALTNPRNVPAYTGKYGSVKGTIKVQGDQAPSLHDELKGVQPNCPRVESMYGKAFREGPDRVVADVLVVATGYEGYVAPSAPYVRVEGSGCAWDRRTIAIMYGQGLEVVAKDRKPYVPDIHGQGFPAQLFALPDQDPIRLIPPNPGRFLFYDAMRLHSRADLFVLPFPTFAVTDEQGHYEIKNIPVGFVKLNALLPAGDASAGKEIEIREGEPVEANFTLDFKAAQYRTNFINAEPRKVPH